MKISELFGGISYRVLKGSDEQTITDLCYNSNEVVPGALFVALVGFTTDAHNFIPDAVSRGASSLLVEKDLTEFPGGTELPETITVIRVSNTREALSHIAVNYFDNPAKKLTLVGVTGTKGKTTTTHMCKAIMEAAGVKTGMIGTIGAFIGETHIETKNTTPESFELQKLFHKMVEEDVKVCFMEVSSQAMKKHRVNGLRFKVGAFTNLSPDHIAPGEHESFEEYKYYKKEFFRQVETAVTNADDPYGLEMVDYFQDYRTFSCKEKADMYASDVRNIWEPELIGVQFWMHGDAEGDMTISIPGIHNVGNALLAAEICHILGASGEAIRKGLRNVYIKGRTQLVREAASRGTFIIDYAHNALSTESVLSTLAAYHPKKMTCIFGGGGNRAVARRYDMGEAASRYADYIVLTEDNPRFEEIDAINKTIIEGIRVHGCPYEVIYDRKEAIEHVLDISKPGEIVCLLGKGHETYQEVRGIKRHFSEEEVIKDYMKRCR